MKLDSRSTAGSPRPKKSEKPSTSSRFPTTLPVSEPRTTSVSPSVDREHRDDQLRRVAERRVQEAADARAGVVRGVLGRLADQPRERDERERGEDEQRDVAPVERVVGDERESARGRTRPRGLFAPRR